MRVLFLDIANVDSAMSRRSNLETLARLYGLHGPFISMQLQRFLNPLGRVPLPLEVQKLLRFVCDLVHFVLPKLYGLWQGLVDSERTAGSVGSSHTRLLLRLSRYGSSISSVEFADYL